MKTLILASQSPRRRELLEKCGIPFEVCPADIDETINEKGYLPDEIRMLAERKARSVLEKNPTAAVIGSDTIVVIDNEILGKPKDKKDAVRMLKRLSGHTHQVITGICIMSSMREYSNVSISEVTFADLDDQEIEKYADTEEPMDKAGAYAVQGIASRYITRIHGDYYSIMGLPVSMVYEELKKLSSY
ncbi:MAG: septum formation inhibitor Maf [Erysipelotrichia bacterium]|nr:septum formation inhibitor Maf [Erysipelotrichia bacterium]